MHVVLPLTKGHLSNKDRSFLAEEMSLIEGSTVSLLEVDNRTLSEAKPCKTMTILIYSNN